MYYLCMHHKANIACIDFKLGNLLVKRGGFSSYLEYDNQLNLVRQHKTGM